MRAAPSERETGTGPVLGESVATITAADQTDEDADALADEAASLADDATQEQQGAAIANAMLAYVQADAPAVTASLEAQAQADSGYAIAQALAIEEYPNGSYDSNYVAAMATATATQQTALQTAATDYALAELAARGPQETAIATADLAAANQTASNITTWQDTTDANDLAASLTIDQAAHDDALADAGNEVDYDESSAELYDEVAQGIAAATSAAGYASLVAEYGPLLAGPIDPSAAPYAAEGASLADAALAEIQSTDTAWLTQQTTTANADLSEENTDATAQAGLINSQAAADATLTVASAQADYNGTLASIAAGPRGAAGPTLPSAPAPLTAASIGFAAPSLPAQPAPAPQAGTTTQGAPLPLDSFFSNLVETNTDANPYAFSYISPATTGASLTEAVNLAATETNVQNAVADANYGSYQVYSVAPTTYAAPTGMTYDAIAPPSGTTGSYDGAAWNPSSGNVSEAWFASAVQNVVSDATQSHAGGWGGIPGATPMVDYGTANATLTTLLDDGTSQIALQFTAAPEEEPEALDPGLTDEIAEARGGLQEAIQAYSQEATNVAFQGTGASGPDWPTMTLDGKTYLLIFTATTNDGETFQYTKVDGAYVVVSGGGTETVDGNTIHVDTQDRAPTGAELAVIKQQVNEPGQQSVSDQLRGYVPDAVAKEARDWMIVGGYANELKFVEDMKKQGASDAQILSQLIPHMAKQEITSQLFGLAAHGVGAKVFGGKGPKMSPPKPPESKIISPQSPPAVPGNLGSNSGLLFKRFGNVDGGSASVKNALTQAEKWLGSGYKEIAPGVYRSADGSRQFRITTRDLIPTHGNIGPHVHFEAIGPDGRTIIENSHVKLLDP